VLLRAAAGCCVLFTDRLRHLLGFAHGDFLARLLAAASPRHTRFPWWTTLRGKKRRVLQACPGERRLDLGRQRGAKGARGVGSG
jgi:hypothetical protein